MSGRKKNRKHRHGQPSHELLNELNSLRDLLGSDLEADIPLLDQVAEAGVNKNEVRKTSAPPAPTRPPVPPQRPLQEADLPILFSPVDEEPVEEYTPLLSEADRELLRPLQDLPRKEPVPEPPPQSSATREATAETRPETNRQSEPEREEFQPGLFDAPKKSAKAIPETETDTKPEADVKAEARAAHPHEKAPQKPVAGAQKPLPAALTENPFLPPHIRARLTGGRIPRPQEESEAKAREPEEATPPQVEPDVEPGVELEGDNTAADAQAENTSATADERKRLIEQLMAEQLPELERQLRANITALVDEIYPEES